ncbi:MAG: N-acetyltransferase family protein [Sporichthyaceae bacterium]|nr:N-acetyltransferase family protein [Sporichthyaceae bacterium]
MTATDLITIRAADPGDLARLDEIYAHYVRLTPVSFDLEPPAAAARAAWLAEHPASGPHRILIAARAGTPVGYASSSRFRDRSAYRSSVETSVYLDPAWVGRGIGAGLYQSLFDGLAGLGLHRAYAAVTLPNPASVALHRRFGFREIGVLDEAGHKFGRYWSVLWLEKPL